MEFRRVLFRSLAGMLAACATRPPAFPEPLREPVAEPASASAEDVARERFEEGPVVSAGQQAAPVDAPLVAPEITGKKPVSLVVDGMPLPAFINVVFGEELGFPLEIEQSVRNRPDLVSLRLTEPQPPEKLYLIAAELLKDYGVQIGQRGSVLRFSPVADPGAEAPQLITTRSLPDVPAGQRTVFVAVPLNASEHARLAGQSRKIGGA